MKYKINWLEHQTTKTGKKKINATLEDPAGSVKENVTIWDGFPNFSELAPGSEIDVDIVTKQNGQYLNVTAYPIKQASGGPRTGIKAAQDRKGEMIKEAQGRKNEAIAFFNATNSAIALLAHAEVDKSNMHKIKEFIKASRDWFLGEWQEYEAKDHTDKHSAF